MTREDIINEIENDKKVLEHNIVSLMNEFEEKWKVLRIKAVAQHNVGQTPEWDAMICDISISTHSFR